MWSTHSRRIVPINLSANDEVAAVVCAKTAYIERGSPWENGYIESFNARLRDELLNGEIFYTLREARIAIESCHALIISALRVAMAP